jgi:hypothetical protein
VQHSGSMTGFVLMVGKTTAGEIVTVGGAQSVSCYSGIDYSAAN